MKKICQIALEVLTMSEIVFTSKVDYGFYKLMSPIKNFRDNCKKLCLYESCYFNAAISTESNEVLKLSECFLLSILGTACFWIFFLLSFSYELNTSNLLWNNYDEQAVSHQKWYKNTHGSSFLKCVEEDNLLLEIEVLTHIDLVLSSSSQMASHGHQVEVAKLTSHYQVVLLGLLLFAFVYQVDAVFPLSPLAVGLTASVDVVVVSPDRRNSLIGF